MKSRPENVLLLLEHKTADYGDKVALGIKSQMGWKEFSYKGLGLMSRKLGSYLINDIKVQKGDKIAILSESKPEYGACVFASVMSGAITVPLDIKLTEFELQSILSDCKPTILLVSQSYLEKGRHIMEKIPSIKHIIMIDEPSYKMDVPCLYTLPNNYECKWRHRSSKSTAVIVYTSGTTGAPKGVEISFRNMLAQMDDLAQIYIQIFKHGYKPTVLSILPMNHLFELTVGFSAFMYWGLSVYYTQSLKPKDILSIMREKHVNFMIVVPAFLKLLKAGIEQELKNSPKAVQAGFALLYQIAGFIPSYPIRKMLFSKIHEKFGGGFYGCISGGAPLDTDVGKFFERIGIRVYQGYGISEASPVVSVNIDKRWDLQSVGKPLHSVDARIDKETGEIQLKGPSIMKGYYNNPEMTAAVLDEDGWLHTGDIGKIDRFGHIHITGRIKNMIVLSGGKKVFPEEVESVMEQSEMFAEVCILGSSRSGGAKDGTEDIVAVIKPKDNIIKQYADDAELNKIVREEVKRLSLRLAAYKRPINIIVVKEPLPKTTTMKIKRKNVKELLNV